MKTKDNTAREQVMQKLKAVMGRNNWETAADDDLELLSFRMNDGPLGVRSQTTDAAGHTSYNNAVCFPASVCMASTWNRELLGKVGESLVNECVHTGTDLLLGPGVNLKRTPLCGRNFEYYSEDPLLAGELAAAYINGLQKHHVGACIKHFAANNQEYDRGHISCNVDERTLRELYLKPFEIAIRKANPMAIMCAYNRLNGIYCSENRWLLTELLREEWGYDGIVVSDWGAVHDRKRSVAAGLTLEMPCNPHSLEQAVEAFAGDEAACAQLDDTIADLQRFSRRVSEQRPQRDAVYNRAASLDAARQVSEEGIVLLKNDGHLLPVTAQKYKKVSVIGIFAEKCIWQGGGSAGVVTNEIVQPLAALKAAFGDDIAVRYEHAYLNDHATCAPDAVGRALEAAREADVCLVFVGNTDKVEAEGFDRDRLALHRSMEMLIRAVAKENPNVAVIVESGGAIDVSAWENSVRSIVMAWYMGSCGALGLADIIAGNVCPSGKLAESFPVSEEVTPAFAHYPGDGHCVHYGEGLMMGYRYYDQHPEHVRYPFGFGLSYTSFSYGNLSLSTKELHEGETLHVTCRIRNGGSMMGKETVQLYVHEVAPRVLRPYKELKEFAKIGLQPGEDGMVEFVLPWEAFAHYNTSLHRWTVSDGRFEILIGASSQDIRLRQALYVRNTEKYS